MIVAEGRLLAQWRDELLAGAPARGLPPLAPNVDVLVLAEHAPDRRPPARASTASSASAPASRWWPTACSTATPASWPRWTGTC